MDSGCGFLKFRLFGENIYLFSPRKWYWLEASQSLAIIQNCKSPVGEVVVICKRKDEFMILRGRLDGKMKMTGKFYAKNPDGSYTIFGKFAFGKSKRGEPNLAMYKFDGLPTWAKQMFVLPFYQPSTTPEQGVVVV
jgi:hypothetical protein